MLDAVRIGRKAAGRTTRAVGGDAVVGASIRSERIGRANSNHRRLVAGRMNLSINLVAVGILAVVTGGGDYHDSRINQRARGATNRIVLVRADRRRAQTHVDDANVVLVFVERIA